MCLSPIYVKGKYVACRKCIECLVNETSQWTTRVMLEASLYSKNCYVTLTYNEDNLPQGGLLLKKDYQDFFKRLRKRLDVEHIRYFGCGEYGSKKNRPHFHFIIFNFMPDDLEYFFTDKDGHKYYKSAFLQRVWSVEKIIDGKKKYFPIGFVLVSNVSERDIRYCCKYLQKLREDYTELPVKPFLAMSRKPAIGYNALTEKMLRDDKIYINGRSTRLPDIFIKKALTFFPALICKIRERRAENYNKCYIAPFLHQSIDFETGEVKEYKAGTIFHNKLYLQDCKKRGIRFRKILDSLKKK